MIGHGPGAASLGLKWDLFDYQNLPDEPDSVLTFALGIAWLVLLLCKRSPYEAESWESKALLDSEEPILGRVGVFYLLLGASAKKIIMFQS